MSPVDGTKDAVGTVAAYPRAAAEFVGRHKLSIVVSAFILSLAVPPNVMLYVGPMRLSPYRILLIIMAVPTFIRLMSGRGGKVRIFDYLLIFHAVWAVLALMVVHGLGKVWETGGILIIESLVPYWIARVYVRTYEDFYKLTKLLYWIVICILPFTAYEALTGHHFISDTFRSMFGGFAAYDKEPRMGMMRAFGPFEHPILYGVFCSSIVAITFYVLGRRNGLFVRIFKMLPIMAATVFSVSSGPVMAMMVQIMLMGWDGITRRIRHRWMILAGLFGLAWTAVSLASTRSPIVVFISYLTFSADTAYGRVLIFQYGSAEVMRHPLFGIGLNDWVRLWWMTASMDNFWLVEAVRYGLPGFLFLAGASLIIYFKLGLARLEDERHKACRSGLLIALIGVTISGCTVDFWNALYVLFIFMLGMGVWLMDVEKPSEAADGEGEPRG